MASDGQVYVRTWYRRDTGWDGHAIRFHRARIRVPGLDTQVTIDDVSTLDASLRQRLDTAYRTKYGSPGTASRVSDQAADTTPRLTSDPEGA